MSESFYDTKRYNEREVQKVLDIANRKLLVLNFRQPLQPQLPTVDRYPG